VRLPERPGHNRRSAFLQAADRTDTELVATTAPRRRRQLRYAATRARVEARATLEQAEEVHRTLEELGRELKGEIP
jgi:hypothetical protein